MTTVNLLPVVSEKAMAATENQHTYVFWVPKRSSKLAIARAVKDQFKVKVQTVNTAVTKGKPKQTPVQRGRLRISGRRSDLKKAYVKLAEGEMIKLFEESK